MIRVAMFPTGAAALVEVREVVVATEREYAAEVGGGKLPVVELTMRSGDTIVVQDARRTLLRRLSVPGQDRESDQYQESLAVLRPYTAQQRAAPGYGPYSLYGRLMDHTVVRG